MMDSLTRRLRHERRRASLESASCATCGEDRLPALVRTSRGVGHCYACRLHQQGKPALERHHLAGRKQSPITVLLGANDHRVLSDAQLDWPARTRENPERSPLLTLAALLRGILDICGWPPWSELLVLGVEAYEAWAWRCWPVQSPLDLDIPPAQLVQRYDAAQIAYEQAVLAAS